LLEYAESSDQWYCSLLTVDDTKAIKAEVLAQEREEIIAKNGDDSIFQQEYYISFSGSIQGGYYTQQLKELEKI